MTTQGFLPTPEEVSLSGAFRNFLLGQSIDPNGIFGRITQSQLQNPLFGAFNLAGLTGQPVGGNINDFLGSGLGNIGGSNNAALGSIANNFQGVANPDQRANLQGLFAGAAPGTDLGNQISNAAQFGLRSVLPQSVAGRFGGALTNQAEQGFEQRLAGQASGGPAAGNFAQFLLSSLGLGQGG